MKTGNLFLTVAILTAVLAFGGESFARGGGGGGGMSGMGSGKGVQTHTQTRTHTRTQTATKAQTRPEGSQRRDGTFLETGATANGSTTRPSIGRGVMDGTGINATAPVVQ